MRSSGNERGRFWFAPLPLGDLAVLRILWVTAQLWHLWDGSLQRAIARFEASSDALDPLPLLRLLALPFGGASALTRGELEIVLVATEIAGVLALVGLRTRWSLVAFATGSLFLQAWYYSVEPLTHYVALLQWSLLLLAASPCAEVLSLDAWFASRSGRAPLQRPDELAAEGAWLPRLVHVLIALAYVSAAATKLSRGPVEWFGGWTLHYYLGYAVLRHGYPAGEWLMGRHFWITAVAWTVIAFEIGFVASLFHRRGRWIWALACTLIHVGAAACMGVFFPSFPVLCACLVPWTDAASAFARMCGTRLLPVLSTVSRNEP